MSFCLFGLLLRIGQRFALEEILRDQGLVLSAEQFVQRLCRQRCAVENGFEHTVEMVASGFHHVAPLYGRLPGPGGNTLQKIFKGVGDAADRIQTDHPRATFEGMEIALQVRHH